MNGPREPRGPTRLLPWWARRYQRPWLRDDLTAGLTLAVMLVPQAMAYASLAGMPPITGLYASIVALLVYAWLGTSSHLSFGPVALVSLLTASALDPLARGETPRYLALAGTLALLVGAMHLLLAAVRAGTIVELISHPVIVGFTAAAGLIIGLSQMRDLTGVDAHRSERFAEGVAVAISSLQQAHPATLAIGVTGIVLLLVGRRVAPRIPMALVVSAVAVLLAVALDLPSRGVAVVGDIPAGLPRPHLPVVGWEDVRALLPAAGIIAAISYAESVSIAKAIAARSRERLDTGRELLGSGAANIAAGLAGGFPVAGSFTRSAVVHDARARTQLAGVIAAGVVVLTLVVLTPVLEPLPRAVLASIVLVAVIGLIDVRAARATFQVDRADGMVLLVTFVATLALGVELGLLTGVGVNLAAHVARGMRPALVILGRVPGTQLYRNVERYPTVTDPHGVVLRLDGPLDFLSVEAVTGKLRRLAVEQPELSWLVLDASGVTGMDSSGVHALHELQEHLAEAGVTLHLCSLRGPQRDAIDRAGLWEALIVGTCHPDIGTALAAVGLPSDAPLRRPTPAEDRPDELR
jgi:sulfate permease, SulP family